MPTTHRDDPVLQAVPGFRDILHQAEATEEEADVFSIYPAVRYSKPMKHLKIKNKLNNYLFLLKEVKAWDL